MMTVNSKERVAKRLKRLNNMSRREAEALILAGNVCVNGKKLDHPAYFVTDADQITLSGKEIVNKVFETKLYAYYKSKGFICSIKDEHGRKTIFDDIKYFGKERLIYVGRLDYNSEGLLLLTNDGDLCRKITLPLFDIPRVYKVRVFGNVTQNMLDNLALGSKISGVQYKPIIANIIRRNKANSWLEITLKEGKNREVRKVLANLGLAVNRLIRLSYGPYHLNKLSLIGSEVKEVNPKLLDKYFVNK